MICMKRQRKKYSRPKKPWSKDRIITEKKLLKEYGLRRKKEIWRVEEKLREFRRRAREIVASQDKEEEKKLIKKLSNLGLINKEAHIDDILALTIEDLLDRRLQTIVFKKGIASTQRQARQFIVHGHISVNGRRIRWPSALMTLEEEKNVGIYQKSKLKDSIAKMRSASKKSGAKTKKSSEDVKSTPQITESEIAPEKVEQSVNSQVKV